MPRTFLRLLRYALFVALGIVLGMASAVFADTAAGVPGADQIPLIAAGGTTGLITTLVIGFYLMLSGRLRRGQEAEDWKAIAQQSVVTLDKFTPSIEKVVSTSDRLLDVMEKQATEARLRREWEQEKSGTKGSQRADS